MSRVFLVGAGPGDPELLTVKALHLIQAADTIIHDSLVSQQILNLASPRANIIDVGKRCGCHSASQDTICALLVREAQRSPGIVLRLKGGDPMVFSRATEEMLALDVHDILYEIVPGITAAIAAASILKISLTQRLVSRAVHFVAGHAADGNLPGHDFAALGQKGGTIAIYMGAQTFGGFSAHLLETGMSPATPAIAIENVSCPDQRIFAGTLGTLPRRLAEESGDGPVLILVGDALAEIPHSAALALALAS